MKKVRKRFRKWMTKWLPTLKKCHRLKEWLPLQLCRIWMILLQFKKAQKRTRFSLISRNMLCQLIKVLNQQRKHLLISTVAQEHMSGTTMHHSGVMKTILKMKLSLFSPPTQRIWVRTMQL